MPNVTRRVLFVLLMLAAAMPFLIGPADVLAKDAAPKPDTPEKVDGDGKAASDKDANDNNKAAASKPAATRSKSGRLTVPTGGKIAIVEIKGPILYQNDLDSIKRRTDRAINDGADLIVFELDTPGGALMIALELSKYIRKLPKPTVAWVNDMALSAGILVASACDELIMAKASQTGDCAPIVQGMNLAATERAKILSPLLSEFRSNARENYSGSAANDFALFHAMCVIGIDVYQVRHKKTGEVRLVSQADYRVMVEGKQPIDATKKSLPNSKGAKADEDEFGGDTTTPVLTVTDKSQVGQWELVKQVHNGSSQLLVTLDETEAKTIGLSRDTVSNVEELKKLYGAASAQRYEETWSESLVGFLVNPWVRALLLLVGIGGLLIEYMSPGLFVPGIVGLAAIGILIGAPFFIGLAQTWHLVIIVIGFALIIYELFTMTTFGVLAVVGLLMFLTGLVLSGVQSATNGLPAPGTSRQIFITSMSFVGAIVMMLPMLYLLTKYFGSLPLLNKLILNDSLASSSADGQPYQRLSGDESVGGGLVKPGMTGTVTSTGLRPSGRVDIEDQLIDVTSTGSFIEPGVRVRVIEVHGNIISVERDDDESTSD